jgi:hypothetical protein
MKINGIEFKHNFRFNFNKTIFKSNHTTYKKFLKNGQKLTFIYGF